MTNCVFVPATINLLYWTVAKFLHSFIYIYIANSASSSLLVVAQDTKILFKDFPCFQFESPCNCELESHLHVHMPHSFHKFLTQPYSLSIPLYSLYTFLHNFIMMDYELLHFATAYLLFFASKLLCFPHFTYVLLLCLLLCDVWHIFPCEFMCWLYIVSHLLPYLCVFHIVTHTTALFNIVAHRLQVVSYLLSPEAAKHFHIAASFFSCRKKSCEFHTLLTFEMFLTENWEQLS